MLTTRSRRTTLPNESGPLILVDLSSSFVRALLDRDIDPEMFVAAPDDTITVATSTGRLAIGEEDGWITAHLVDDVGESQIYEGYSLSELADTVAVCLRTRQE